MTRIIKRNKALSVNPLKVGQPVGAALAFLGLDRSIPMLHGSQGCTAFAKVYLIRHFREPMPMQTTAMDQVSTVMGADGNIVAGLDTLCRKARPAVIGLLTTGLAETEGADIHRVLKVFRLRHPEHEGVTVVPVNTPDYRGCLESGYALAVQAMVDTLVPTADKAGTRPGRCPEQINVLAGASLTPGDVEALKEIVEAFGLSPTVVPDLGDSLDGHLVPADFSPVTVGGTPVPAFPALGNAAATLVVGASMSGAADRLRELTGVPDYRFDHLMGLDAVDALMMVLREITGRAIPARLERHRSRLQDAMLDTHFMLGKARVALALEPDLLKAFADLLTGAGAEVAAAVAPATAPVLERMPAGEVKLGDLEDLERLAQARHAALLIGNSHAADAAGRLGVPLLRAGIPVHDRVGAHQRTWIGYRGACQALFDMANLLLAGARRAIPPYRSIYRTTAGVSKKTASQSRADEPACFPFGDLARGRDGGVSSHHPAAGKGNAYGTA